MAESNQNEPTSTQPRTPVEELIAATCGSLLGVQSVGVFDSFLELGGNPDLVDRLADRLRELFRVEMTSSEVLTAPTVDGLVSILARKWGGREIIDEIAWTFMQVDQLSNLETDARLRSEIDDEMDQPTSDSASPEDKASANKRRLIEVLLERTGITFERADQNKPVGRSKTDLPES